VTLGCVYSGRRSRHAAATLLLVTAREPPAARRDRGAIDRAVPPHSGQCTSVNLTRARTLAPLGRRAEAGETLERALLRANTWYLGWYLFDRDPACGSMHSDPKFQALRAAYRADIDAEQRKLAELRSAGLVAERH